MATISFGILSDEDARLRVCSELESALAGDFLFLNETPRKDLCPTFVHKPTGTQFKLIPAGEFTMGFSEKQEFWARKVRDPIPVNLKEMRPAVHTYLDAFLMSCLPITTTVFEKVTGQTPSGLQQQNEPVRAKFSQASAFASRFECSLPTEYQWERACRGGGSGPFIWGLALPPKEKLERWLNLDFGEGYESKCQRNAFGLYGLFSGEWCQDEWRPSHSSDAPIQKGVHVVKGGGAMFWPWQDQEWVWCMPAMRMPETGLFEDRQAAFRLVKNLPVGSD